MFRSAYMPDYNDRYIPPAENRPAHPSLRKNIVNGYNTFFCLNDNIVGIYLNIPYSILTFDLLIELGTSANIDRDNPPDFASGETVTVQRNTIKPSWANTGRTPDARYIGDIMEDPEYLPLLPSAYVRNYDKSLDSQIDRTKVSTTYKQAAGFYYGALIPIDCDYPAVHMRNCLPVIFREEDVSVDILDATRGDLERTNTYLTNAGRACRAIAEHALTKEYGIAGSAAFQSESFPIVDNDYNVTGTCTIELRHLTPPARPIYNDSEIMISIDSTDLEGSPTSNPPESMVPLSHIQDGINTLESVSAFCTAWKAILDGELDTVDDRINDYMRDANSLYNQFALASLNDQMKFLQSLARLHDVALTDESTSHDAKALSNIISAEDNKSIMQNSFPTRLNAAASEDNITIFPDRMEIFRHGALYVVTVDAGDPTGSSITRLHLVKSGSDTAVMSDIDTNSDQTITYSPLPPVMEVVSQPVDLGTTSGVNVLKLFDKAIDNRSLLNTDIKDSDFDATYLFGHIDVLRRKVGVTSSDENTIIDTMESTYNSVSSALLQIYEGDEIGAYSIFPLLFSFGQGMFLIDDTVNYYMRLHDSMPTVLLNNTAIVDRLKIDSLGMLFEHDFERYPPSFLRAAGLEYRDSLFHMASDRSKWQGPFWENIRSIGELIGTKELYRDETNGPIRYMFVRDENNMINCPTPISHYLVPEESVNGRFVNVETSEDITVNRYHIICVYDNRNPSDEDEDDKIRININAHPRMNENLSDLVDDEDFDPETLDEPETIPINEIRLPNLEEIKQHYFIRDPRPESRTMADLLRKWTKIVTREDGEEQVIEGNSYPSTDIRGYSINYMRNEVPTLMENISNHAISIYNNFLCDNGSDSLLHNIGLYESNLVEFNKNSIKRFMNDLFVNSIDKLVENTDEDINTARSALIGSINGLIGQITEHLEPDQTVRQQVIEGLTQLKNDRISGDNKFRDFVKAVGKHAKSIISEILVTEDGNIFDDLLTNHSFDTMNEEADIISITEDTDNISELVDEYGKGVCTYTDLTFIEEVEGKYKYTVILIGESSIRQYFQSGTLWNDLSDSFKGEGTIEGCVLRSLESDPADLLITQVYYMEEDPADTNNTIITFASNTMYDTVNESTEGIMYDVALFRGIIQNVVGGTDNGYNLLSMTNYRRYRDDSETPSYSNIESIFGTPNYINPSNSQLLGTYATLYKPISFPDAPEQETTHDAVILVDSQFNGVVSDTNPQISIFVFTKDPSRLVSEYDHTDCRIIIYRSRDRWNNTIWNYLPVVAYIDEENIIPNELDSTYDDLFTSGISYDCSENLYASDKHSIPARDAGLLSEIKPYIYDDNDTSLFKRSYSVINIQIREVYRYIDNNYLSPFDELGGYSNEDIWDEFYVLDENVEEGDIIPPPINGLTNTILKNTARDVTRPLIVELGKVTYRYIYKIIALMKDAGVIIENILKTVAIGNMIEGTRSEYREALNTHVTQLKEMFQSVIDNNPFASHPMYGNTTTKLYEFIQLWKNGVELSRTGNIPLKEMTYIPMIDGSDYPTHYYDDIQTYYQDNSREGFTPNKAIPLTLLGRFASQIVTLSSSIETAIIDGYSITMDSLSVYNVPITIRQMNPPDEEYYFYRNTVEAHMLLYTYLLYFSIYISMEEALIGITTRLLQFYCIQEDVDYPGDTFGTMGGLELVDKREWIELLGASFYHKLSDNRPIYPLIPDEGIEMDGGVSIKKHEISNILDYEMPFRYKINIKLPDDLEKELHKVLFKNPNLGWLDDFPDDE